MKRRTARHPRPTRAQAADPPLASADTSGRTICDDCERRATCGIDLSPDPIQGWLWDQEHPLPPLAITH